MKEKFNLLYIDDGPDPSLEKYLDREYRNADYDIEYSEIRFDPSEGYESLIGNPKVKSANIVFIDSTLFENKTVGSSKFTGEEFKIILRKYYPFIEVIVITQNDADSGVGTIAKYNKIDGKTAAEYYAETLPNHIEKSIQNILIYRRLAKKLEGNENWETTLKEKIINSLQGVGEYDELTKSDIDQLIEAFKEIQEKINAG